MTHKFSRRDALVGLSSTFLLQSGCTNLGRLDRTQSNSVFLHGVASGDPDQTSVVIWTRISSSVDAVDVDYHVSTDPDFRDLVKTGRATTDRSRDHTLKIVVENLLPGKHYYYRFSTSNADSPIGRTKTLPIGPVGKVVLAVASCSNYPFGYFNAYEAIAEDDEVDLVFHLGDYIYEYAANGA